MAVTQLPVGVNKQDLSDPDWHVGLNGGFDALDARLRYTSTTSPEGVFVGRWVGQRHYDTLRHAFWVFTGTPGNTTGWVREIPQGVVMMWSGTIGSIPAGWVLCNGVLHAPTGYTPPNLSGKFIAGYDAGDADYNAIGDTGGEKTHVLTEAEMPAHAHPGSTTGSVNASLGVISLFGTGNDNNRVRGGDNVPNGATYDGNTIPNHSHSLSIASQGGGAAHENRPPFYTLAYIAKL